ncbi:MAG: hypothetical protein JWM78_3179 [Verrucomicrobiaceae bacterium]|nr:hypothetical protein [Verrucomicrobiaceae bacterium]
MNGILVLFHCESNTGYAIGRLEPIFFKMALQLCQNNSDRVHFAYTSMMKGKPTTLPSNFEQYVVIDSANNDKQHGEFIENYVKKNRINILFGFDQPVNLPTYKYFRRGGIRKFVSYWGAPMSSLFGPAKRLLKQINVLLRPNGPDLYIFESLGMADTAVLGRGISIKKTRVVYLSVDHNQFRPDPLDHPYVYEQFAIPKQRKIFFYSGHMEHRKGTRVIMNAANHLFEHRKIDDWHILLLGNRPGEEQPLLAQLAPTVRDRVIFGGYRDDINKLHRGCYAGIIASTGWDSLTCSSLEMQASGLPLIASNLPGLRESVATSSPQLLFEPGDHKQLAELMSDLLDNSAQRNALSETARAKTIIKFSTERQIRELTAAVEQKKT